MNLGMMNVTGFALAAMIMTALVSSVQADDKKVPEGWKKLELPKWGASFAVPEKWIEDKIDLGKGGISVLGAKPDEDNEAFYPEFGLIAGTNMIPTALDKVADTHVKIAKAGTQDFKVVKREKVQFLGRDAVSMIYDGKMYDVWTRTVEMIIETEKDKKAVIATYTTMRDDYAAEEKLIEQCFNSVKIQ